MGLLYEMLSKHGWVRDFIEIGWIFHLNHNNSVTYEPFLKKLQKKSNPNIRLESIPGAYGLRTARTRAVRPNAYDRHDFQITVFIWS